MYCMSFTSRLILIHRKYSYLYHCKHSHFFKLFCFLFFILFTNLSTAADVCNLDETSLVLNEHLSQEQIEVYHKKIEVECRHKKIYQSLLKKAAIQYGLKLEQIYGYQGPRFIKNKDLQRAQLSGTPLQVIYQRYYEDLSKPNHKKSSEIWDNWIQGAKQLPQVRSFLLTDETLNDQPSVQPTNQLSAEILQNIHQGFYSLSDETGDYSHLPYPGQFKPNTSNDEKEYAWWQLKSASEAEQAVKVFQQQNQKYYNLGLLPNFYNESNQLMSNSVLRVLTFGSDFFIFSSDYIKLQERLEYMFKFFNKVLDFAIRKEAILINNQLLTPGEAAYLLQQYFIGLHPFYEGNGRISRFLQELILTSFQLPHGPSGELMDIDVLTNLEDYYQAAMRATDAQLKEVADCIEVVYPKYWPKNQNSPNQNPQSDWPYQCHILPKNGSTL